MTRLPEGLAEELTVTVYVTDEPTGKLTTPPLELLISPEPLAVLQVAPPAPEQVQFALAIFAFVEKISVTVAAVTPLDPLFVTTTI